MEQKTTWMRYLLIGISSIIIFALSGCSKTIIGPLKTVSYIYRNDSNTDLIMKVYNYSGGLINSFEIASNQEIITNTTMAEGPALFSFDSNVNSIGVSIVVEFKTMKCLFYTKNGIDKIFDITQYDNYSIDLLNQNKYSLRFSFNESDFESS